MEIPRVETARLVLRGFEERDLDAYAALCADPQVMDPLGGTLTRAAAWRQMTVYLGHWMLRGFGMWVLEEKTTGRLAGRTGLWMPEGWPALEVGWALSREQWGRGYATEAARASLEHAWHVLGARRVISLVRPQNERSAAVARRIGERLVGSELVGGIVHDVWAVDRPEAQTVGGIAPTP